MDFLFFEFILQENSCASHKPTWADCIQMISGRNLLIASGTPFAGTMTMSEPTDMSKSHKWLDTINMTRFDSHNDVSTPIWNMPYIALTKTEPS